MKGKDFLNGYNNEEKWMFTGFTVTEDMTLTAKWTANTYTISFVSDDGTVAHEPMTVTYDSGVVLPELASREYYEPHWYNEDAEIVDGIWKIANDVTLTAKYTSIFILSENAITGLTDYGKVNYNSIVIPSEIDGIAINKISREAFKNYTTLTDVSIPESVTSIESYAFSGCVSLQRVTIGNGVTSISGYAFSGCTNLSYKEYGNAFYLGNDSNPYLALISAENTEITSVEIHEDTKIVAGHAFYKCTSLLSVNIPNNVTVISGSTFAYCTNLSSVIIPNSVTYIGDNAFRCCKDLMSVTIPDGVTYIGVSAFQDCASLTSLVIPEGVTTLGTNAFSYCTSLRSVTIPETLTNIGDRPFFVCNALKYNEYNNAYYLGNTNNPYLMLINAKSEDISYIQIHEDTKFICDYAFANCKNLTSVKIPNGVTSINKYTFYGCTSLMSIEIGNTVTSVGIYAFNGCSSLTNITIPKAITSIGIRAFYDCESLESIYYHGTVSEWDAITIGSSNTYLTNATIYYYSENEPTINADGTAYNGNYWHFDENGEIVVWQT